MQPDVDAIVQWYDREQRPLPWRAPDTTPWGVLVSEVMAHQTQVARVAVAWTQWMRRWPTPAALAADAPAAAVRHWDRLGYPRRALWLHAAATRIVEAHAGSVPADFDALVALPGIGEYTANAVLAFAFGRRVPVLDVNVRRVHARLLLGVDGAQGAITGAERERALALLPMEPAAAAHASQAFMEFGALICTARTPLCDDCPVARGCAWLAAGSPPAVARRRQAAFAGSDRQCRGSIMRVLREATGPVPASVLERVWVDDVQRQRALQSLLADGLVQEVADGVLALPGDASPVAAP